MTSELTKNKTEIVYKLTVIGMALFLVVAGALCIRQDIFVELTSSQVFGFVCMIFGLWFIEHFYGLKFEKKELGSNAKKEKTRPYDDVAKECGLIK